MSRIPQVRKEIKYSLYKTVIGLKGEDRAVHLKSFWKEFKLEQPELADILSKEMEAFKSVTEMGAFAHGAWLVYAALKSQQEADEMNENWGT